ncbi:MAG: guanylate kinase [Dehalococcoidales bacterium]|nr:guanylate kinase [Dehalococcoidales bacterium]
MSHNSVLDIPRTPLLVILSGPSGAGKDAVLTRMKQSGYPIEFITTVTTRPRRTTERDNIDYRFITTAEFEEMIARNEFLEWANVYGNWYGVPKKAVRQALEKGRDVIVKIDVQGAATIKKIASHAVFIFVTPPTIEELVQRLKQRNTETAFDLELRTKTAETEIKQLPLFDYIVFNRRDEIDKAVADIQAIITAEKCCIQPRQVTL